MNKTTREKEDEANTKEEMGDLQLQNEILQQMMNKTTREKEEVLVHHDVMKLEVSRLRTKLTARTEQVFALENRKQQLQLSMQERVKEVEVHLDVLRAQHRVAQDERHSTAIELAERKIRALENTLAHLLTRNQKYKENFKKVDKRAEQQVLEKQQLDEQSRAANETLFKKKQHLAQIDKEFE